MGRNAQIFVAIKFWTCIVSRGVTAVSGSCTHGFVHSFNGYNSCALDPTNSCAIKVLDSIDVSMERCIELCGDACIGVSLFEFRECWIYSSQRGEEVNDDRSIFCARAQPPSQLPPPPPPPPVFAQVVNPVVPAVLSGVQAVQGAQTLTTPPRQSMGPLSAAQRMPVVPFDSSNAEQHEVAFAHLQQAGDSLKAAGGALFAELPVSAVVALAVGGCIGVLLLLAGCFLLRNGLPDSSQDEIDFYASDEEEASRASTSLEPAPVEPARPGAGSQRVLIEVEGKVSTKRVRTNHCRTLKQLRQTIAEACSKESGGAPPSAMLLEYLDEQAGLAITVNSEAQLSTVLRKPTLKATFQLTASPPNHAKASRSAVSVKRAPAAHASGKFPTRKGRRHKAGYERAGLADSDDEADQLEPQTSPLAKCAIM